MARAVTDPEDSSLEVWPTPAADIPGEPAVAAAWPAVETKEEPSSIALRPPSEVQGRVDESFGALATPLQEPPEPLADWGAPGPMPVTEGLASLVRTKIGRSDAVMGQTEQRLEEDRARIKKAYDATGVQPGELLPWDYDQQRQKFATNPLESFGSIGSVFAILASAFTRDPMTNALNGAAAAMNAVREGNDKEYARAYDAWQKNNDLTVKRHNIQQHAYDNAIHLMDTDLNVGRAKLQMEAARFGDQKTLWLLENGMDKEVIELQRQRSDAIKSQVEASTMLTQDGFRRAAFKTMMKDYDTQAAEISGQSPAEIAGRKLALFNHVFGKSTPVPQEAFGLLLLGMPDQPIEKVIQRAQDMGIMPHRMGSTSMNTPAEIARRAKAYEEDPNSPTFGDHAASYDRAAREVKTATAAPSREGTEAEFIARRSKEIRTENPEIKQTEADKQAAEEWKKAKTPARAPTTGTVNATEVERRKKEKMEQGMSEADAFDAATKEVKAAGAPGMTANYKDKLVGQVNQYKHSMEKIDGVIGTLNKYVGTAGVPGYARRLEERLSNLAGSKKTEFVQMMRDIEYLRLEGPRLLLNAAGGRPLSAEEKRINNIIGGLNAGDTTANTLRSMREVKSLYGKSVHELESRIGGAAPAASEGDSGGAEPDKGGWWKRAPLKDGGAQRAVPGLPDDIAPGSPEARAWADAQGIGPTTERILQAHPVNPVGWEQWLESAPESENVEDRRPTADQDALRGKIEDLLREHGARQMSRQQAGPSEVERRAVRALEDLRRKMGVTASTPGGRDTDAALKAIEEALKLAPGNK